MGEEFGLDGQTGEFPPAHRSAEMGGVPANDNGGASPDADGAVPAQVRVVLVRALEEDFVLELRQSLVGCQSLANGNMRLRGGRRSLMVAPPGKSAFR